VNPSIRYQPLRGNSGFYFVRNNIRTRAALKDAVMRTDQLFVSRSHQQTLLEVLSEHISYHGLRVKTFDAYDTHYFPNGGHFQTNKAFMKEFIAGKLKDVVYLFHMNWTTKKHFKLAYMRQMGEWFVRDTCLNQPLNTTLWGHANNAQNEHDGTISTTCCSREPLFSCHYRDKPSIKECKSSPAQEKDGPSWW
jgi:hypothetical protein